MESFKEKCYRVIFHTDTKAGKDFDIALIVLVLLSVLIVMLESMEELKQKLDGLFFFLEWFFTIIFSIEVALRIYCVKHKFKYIFSFYGIVDILSILPAYFTVFFPGIHTLGVIRALRILRIFRILKLNRYIMASNTLREAISASKPKITVFLGTVLIVVIVIGAIMYIIEGPENGFSSIPKSVYWAIVTMTTVGFGDLVPKTALGQFISSLLMVIGYGIIAVPTGLVTADLVNQNMQQIDPSITCKTCKKEKHEKDARYCNHCGNPLN